MTTPAAMTFSALVSLTGLLFFMWHTWHYDRWRCLLYTKENWFRAMMCHILLGSVTCLQIYSWMDVHVLYAEYRTYFPSLDKVYVTPWTLWSPAHCSLWRVSLYFITVGWAFMQGVHLEEFLYWGYLIRSIDTPGGPRSSWLNSGFFKTWVVLFLSCFGLLMGSLHIETDDLDMMRAYLFIVGSCLSMILAFASIALCIVFPSFLRSVKRQGATFEVLERLHFFAEMNEIRTACRLVYSVAFLCLSADAFTATAPVHTSPFWGDVVYLCGQMGMFSSTCLSVIILLPRNMATESLPSSGQQAAQHMVPYKRPAPDGYCPQQFRELGERLNIGQDGLANGIFTNPGHGNAFEMQTTPPHDRTHNDSSSDHSSKTKVDAPFAETADKSRLARLSELPRLPSVVQKFKSPFEAVEPKVKGPTQIFVTSHTIIEE